MKHPARPESPAPIRPRSPREGPFEISWWQILIVLIVVYGCLFSSLGAIGLVGPDEPRYAAVARAMAQTGDWVTPRLYGQPWLEKPVLYYWTAGIAFRLFEGNEFAARLPAALAALVATAAMAFAALRSYGLQTSWLTLLLLPASVAFIGFSRAASPDMLFSATLAVAAAAAAEMLQKSRPGRLAAVLFGASVGAATLAKGPAALVLAGGAVVLWALLSRQWRGALRLTHPLSLTAWAFVAVPWYALCAARNPDFLRIFFLEHNFLRYLTPVFEHVQPVWYFGPILLLAVVPWTPLLIPLGRAAWKSGLRAHDSPALFLGCWAAFPFLFFSFSQSKLPGYILPSVPPLAALLAAAAAPRLASVSAPLRGWLVLVGCMFPALSLAAVFWLRRLPERFTRAEAGPVEALLVLATIGGIVCILLALGRREMAAVAAAALVMAVLVASANRGVLPRIDPFLSAREAARVTLAHAGSAGNVCVFDLHRSWHYGLNFYLDRELPECAPGSSPAWIWTAPSGATKLERSGVQYTVVVRVAGDAWLLHSGPAAESRGAPAGSAATSPLSPPTAGPGDLAAGSAGKS